MRTRGAGLALLPLLSLLLLVVGCGAPETPSGARDGVVSREARVPAEGALLAGELTLPARAGPADTVVPVVVVVSGTGPHDRDGARDDLPGYRPFLDIALALGGQGIAVLRLDDRGTGRSTGSFAGRTTADHADDLRAVLAWLRGPHGVPGARPILLGHSEGGVVALLVAAGAPADSIAKDSVARISLATTSLARESLAAESLAGVVLLGTPARSGRELARWQRAQYVGADMAEWPAGRREAALARADADAEALARQDPWLREWFALDPRAAAARVRAPALVLHGERDGQVPPAHADDLGAALRGAGAAVTVRRFAATDHLLLADHDGDPRGYARLGERTVRREITDEIARWVHATMRATMRANAAREGNRAVSPGAPTVTR